MAKTISQLNDGTNVQSGDEAAVDRGSDTVRVPLDTFNAMPTVGGNPIVESGSNSDGEWARWADGTQLQWGMADLGTLSGSTIHTSRFDLPMSSVDIPIIAVRVGERGRRELVLGTAMYTTYDYATPTKSSVDVRSQNDNTQDQAFRAAFHATSRWF